MCGTRCAQSLSSLTERSFPGRTFMHARFKALGAKGTPGATDALPNVPKWGGSAVTMSRDCFYQASCSAHTLKGTHTLMYLLKQLIILLQVHHGSKRWLIGGAGLDGQELKVICPLEVCPIDLRLACFHQLELLKKKRIC